LFHHASSLLNFDKCRPFRHCDVMRRHNWSPCPLVHEASTGDVSCSGFAEREIRRWFSRIRCGIFISLQFTEWKQRTRWRLWRRITSQCLERAVSKYFRKSSYAQATIEWTWSSSEFLFLLARCTCRLGVLSVVCSNLTWKAATEQQMCVVVSQHNEQFIVLLQIRCLSGRVYLPGWEFFPSTSWRWKQWTLPHREVLRSRGSYP